MVHLLNTSESGTKSYHNNDIISTREHFDYQSAGQLIQGHNMTDYVYSSNLANNKATVKNTINFRALRKRK